MTKIEEICLGCGTKENLVLLDSAFLYTKGWDIKYNNFYACKKCIGENQNE